MKAGDTSNELYIIVQGSVSVFHHRAGELEKIDELRENEMVGEMAQFDGLPRSATVVANEPVKALSFKPENFHLLFQLHPKWSNKLLQTLARRIDSRRQDLVHIDVSLID